MEGTALSALIASRICHDLISPVGAIGNGLELLAMAPGGMDDEAALIKQSADAAAASLKFMRIAFGARADEDVLGLSEVARIFCGYLNQPRRSVTWAPQGGEISRADAQMLFLAALALVDTSPLGGEMVIENYQASPFSTEIALIGASVRELPVVETPTPRDAHRLLLDLRADERRCEVSWSINASKDDNASARVTLRGF